MKKVVIALGGNAILQPKQEATYENQLDNVQKSCMFIAKLIESGYQVIVTHGNGPQVGNILRQNEEARHVVPPFPLDVCSAESQGFIGYMIENSLRNELHRLKINKQVMTLLTEVKVFADDPAFSNPTKPIGVFYSEKEAKHLAAEKNWVVKEDAGRGWRRVVASPIPRAIISANIIKSLADAGHIVISSGGGGIPVVEQADGQLIGVEAVIDKDRSGYRLAQEVGADIFMILTDVDHAYIHYGKPEQKALGEIALAQIKQYAEQGHFKAGSMGPKVEAAIAFAETGGTSIICSLEKADAALRGEIGTRIIG